MNQDENLLKKTVETNTYPPDDSGIVKVITQTTYEREQNQERGLSSPVLLQNYLNEHHELLIKNSVAQEKLIIQISTLLIGSTLTFSKLLEETDLDFYTLLGVYLFISTIIGAVLSYSVAQYVIRVLMEKAEKYYNDETGKIPRPEVTKHWAEIVRKSLDYLTAALFCTALPITFFGVSKQYEVFRTNQKKEENMSNSANSTRSIGPKTVQEKPNTNGNTSSDQGKKQ